MAFTKDLILQDGTLNGDNVLKREPLYTGTNGKVVERFFTSAHKSYIFKPLTNVDQHGKEKWIYELVLPSLKVRTPRLIAASSEQVPEKSWMVFEDLGPLVHDYNENIVGQLIESMADWHAYQLKCSQQARSLRGPKPLIGEMAKSLLTAPNYRPPISRLLVEKLFRQVETFSFSATPVFSHGDLHLGNYALIEDKVVVLDWEHAHFNLPYWDLYHLVDLTHPLFLKPVIPDIRERVLDRYLIGVGLNGEKAVKFKEEYYLFSVIFSMWMLQLIEKDLAQPQQKWPIENLLKQREETLAALVQCLDGWSK